ncbi:MAG: nitroreductase family protein [Corynebacterium sp.]|nr:nitroreductase family protein [Corynebacterium sp.]
MTLNVQEAIESRRATRKYTDQEITDEVLDRVVNLALQAPTAFNAQRADLVVVRDQAVKDAIFAASGQRQHRDAPVVLVVVARTGKPTDLAHILGAERAANVEKYFDSLDAATLRETAIKDAMLVAGFALLAAQNEGLASSPTTGWDEAGVLKAVGLEANADHGVALVTSIGYPDETPVNPGREANRRINNHY